MNLARSVADVLAEHVTFAVECIDRMYCNVYIPRLQFARGLVGFVHRQLGLPVASTAPLAAITDRFSTGPCVREGSPDSLGGLRQGSACVVTAVRPFGLFVDARRHTWSRSW
jgi:hypothetical protein